MLATGARHAYFGHDEWEPFAPGLKTLEDATTIRRRILLAFERAERETDPAAAPALLTFVIIGGGPTGVELAGTIAELARDTLRANSATSTPSKTRVVLIEAGPARAGGLSRRSLGLCAARAGAAGRRGELGQPVTECDADGVVFGGKHAGGRNHHLGGRRAASPAAEWLGAAADRAGRVLVEPDLTVPGHPDIFAIGDTVDGRGPGRQAGARHRAGRQAAGHARRATLIRARLRGEHARRRSATGTTATSRRSASARR